MDTHNYTRRHVGPNSEDIKVMLDRMGLNTVEQLIDETIPRSIRLNKEPELEEGMTEYAYLNHMRKIAHENKIFKSYIGLGYYNTIVPPVIMRNVFENPGWYTAYTPYQAEISQGRLEALLNFQTMVSQLTGLPLSNSSLLDEGTAAAEAMLMLFHARSRVKAKAGANRFLVSKDLFPQTIEVLKTRAESRGIILDITDHHDFVPADDLFGCMVQYPDQKGEIHDFSPMTAAMKAAGIPVAVAADLMSLVLLMPPGEWGADVVFGSSQRFGVPMGYGGPHAAFFAASEAFKRTIPGRIIGISKDRAGKPALRMALQTREQHIKREKATSNICTAQALLAIMAGFYGVYHGKEGLIQIAQEIHNHAKSLFTLLKAAGFEVVNKHFFDTLTIKLPAHINANLIREHALKRSMNFRYPDNTHIGISLDETTRKEDVEEIVKLFDEVAGNHLLPKELEKNVHGGKGIPEHLQRTSDFMNHSVFKDYHSETAMMRYMKRLENRDLALNRSMIPLGSCTMKLNAAAKMMPVSWPEFTDIHPFVPKNQAKGYHYILQEMERMLCEITGFEALSFMPNSGAAGEYTGLMVIRAYLKDNDMPQRNVCLIPASAHGTNPASSVMAGFQVVVVKSDDEGNIDVEDLKAKAEQYGDQLGALMVTYPSTHGIFEERIKEIVDIIHQYGGLVYMDGANMNAQVGYTNPATIGADVCHLNLHKTFGIPHGGGGPGVGPIGVNAKLKPYLPGHIFVETGGEKGIGAVSSAPFGSALVILISYGYLKMLGKKGLKETTKWAIFNANYLMHRLKEDYPILYRGKNGRVGHEMILDCNAFARTAGIQVVDIAKRLMDYGFHAPTVAFPVHGTLMVEPTESEPLESLDRFIEAMKKIREEIKEVEEEQAEKGNNVVVNAPHTAGMVVADDYSLPYSREKAAFPLEWVREDKYFPPVSKIDDAYGDRNLCACLPVQHYEGTKVEVKEF